MIGIIKIDMKQILELQRENVELKKSIGNLMLLIMKKQRGEDYDWLVSKTSEKEVLNYISGEIRRIFDENKKLKEK